MPLKGTVTYKDLEANFSTMRFVPASGKTLADVDTLAVILDGVTDCDRRAHGLIDKTYAAATGAGNRDVKGVVTVSDSNGDTHRWEVPGYNGDSEQDKLGEHMIDPDLAAIIAGITALTGEAYTALRSPVIQTR